MVKRAVNNKYGFINSIKYSANNQNVEVDLHDLPLHTSMALVRYCLVIFHSSNRNRLIIITGKGNHINSDGSRRVLRKEIEIYIRDTLGIENVQPDPKNDGRLIVTNRKR